MAESGQNRCRFNSVHYLDSAFMRFTVSTRAGRVIAVGPRSVMSAMPVRGVSFGLASIKMPPAACISCGKLAAGYTVADVPITIMQVAFELCRKHESKVPRGIGSPNITVSGFTGDPQSGHIGGKLFDGPVILGTISPVGNPLLCHRASHSMHLSIVRFP